MINREMQRHMNRIDGNRQTGEIIDKNISMTQIDRQVDSIENKITQINSTDSRNAMIDSNIYIYKCMYV